MLVIEGPVLEAARDPLAAGWMIRSGVPAGLPAKDSAGGWKLAARSAGSVGRAGAWV